MLSISNLYKKHKGKEIFIVGTGPSNRLFPFEYLKDKITISLNQAYKYFRPTYSLTIHPYLIPIKKSEWNCKWITKVKESDHSWEDHIKAENDKCFFLFNNSNDWDTLKTPGDSNKLFVGCGIQTGAIHLAAKMGAKTAILIGVDCCVLNAEHHGKDQHVEYHGYKSFEVLNEYMYYTVRLKKLIKEQYKMNVLSINPFVGLANIEEQYKYANLEHLPLPKEVENNVRTTTVVRDFIQ